MTQRETINCPNCGAPISADRCPYCGTVFYDFSCIDTESVNYIKIRHAGKIHIFRALLTDQTMTITPTFCTSYCDNAPVICRQVSQDMELVLRFVAVPDERGIYYKRLEV